MTHCCDHQSRPAPKSPNYAFPPGTPEYEASLLKALGRKQKTPVLKTLLLLFLPVMACAQMPEATVHHDPRWKDTTLTLEQRIAVVREEAAIETRNLIEQIEALKYEICRLKEEQERMRTRIATGYWPKKQSPCSKGDEE